ncbi:MAG TPA: GGDEF domain-containing protein [Acidisarcina sp.]
MRVCGLFRRQYLLLSASLFLVPGVFLLPGAATAQATSPAPAHPIHWESALGKAALFGLLLWTYSYFRFRRLSREKAVLEQRLMDAAAELEEEKSVLSTLRKLPARDSLTMAWNRTAIMEILVREMLRAVRENSSLGIIVAELDDLKALQELRGSPFTECVIQQVAERLVSVMRAYDSVGHYRDNDFLIVLPGWNPESAPQRIVGVLDTIGLKPCLIEESPPLRVTSSLGVAAFDPRMDSPYPEDLLRRADEALHMSKAAGPNHAVVAPR